MMNKYYNYKTMIIAISVLFCILAAVVIYIVKSTTTDNNVKTLENRLLELGYTNLFLRLNKNDLDEIWNSPKASQRLQQITEDDNANPEARFLAAEILFTKQPNYPAGKDIAVLVDVYTTALSTTNMGNIWGLPGHLDGKSGQHFVSLGKEAVPSLKTLLTNETKISFIGSQEATYGNSYNYRVKDFAAFYISQILDLPYTVHQTADERDLAIGDLIKQIDN